ncbi:acetylornithine deacetylase/succinyl-diaminopimelate desuccinylase-like protein [Scopulibacillus darangshiensis]|uniref:Acetylornithine deacetylase/succinyl-diaminopimelate desuccinylase-like protein n=1 Tax=Scopulibacillus darangshiensis TaxID=442528 RepID=A0A4R2NZE6_9BACL|nr:dipeptidase [Scopulibacillus darangshiensis]TCP27024.1 acetylornithine deacetylase/succinyl-diaminopimelate desuccinylase-like protein [Scopulibacillus darangshiensis]
MNEDIKQYLKAHREPQLNQLKNFLSLESISSLSEHKDDVKKTADWVADELKAAGLEHVKVMETEKHPVVYGDWLKADGKPTVLIYGHYDVQPVDPIELWETPPFEPDIRDDKIFARGASDDKGQVFMHIKVIEAILKTKGELPVNVKFCIEGEEEIGSPSLDPFVDDHHDLLKADVLLVSDTTMVERGMPSVCYGLRGLCGLQIDLKGPKGDLHSGLYGGAVQNTIHALVELLGTMHNNNGQVTVDGFYDNVRPLTKEEIATYESLSHDDKMKKQVGVKELYGEEGFSTIARIWGRPTLEINGIYGGFQGEGIKTVIPSLAHAKISCRIVPDQKPDEIAELLQKHIAEHLPVGVTAETTLFDQAKPFITPYDHPAIEAAGIALKEAYGVAPTYSRMGGSVPIVETFNTKLGLPAVLMGFGLNEENFHAPNEHFHLENFDKGMEALIDFLYELDKKL